MKKHLCTVLLLGLSTPAFAAQPPVSVSGQIWGDFSLNTGNNDASIYWGKRGVGYSGANITRAYITTSARFNDRFSGLVTADANANPGTLSQNTGLTATPGQLYFLKYAFLQMDAPLPTVSNVKLGLIPTPWYPTEAAYWRYSFQSLDIGTKYLGLTTSAFGTSASGAAGRLHYDLGVFDLPARAAASYKLPAGNTNYNDYQARIGIDLDPGLQLSALYSYYRPLGGTDRQDAFASILGYQSPNLTLAGEYALGWNGGDLANTRVASAFGILNTSALLSNTAFTLRYDNVNRVSGLSHSDWIAGLGFHPVQGVNLMLANTLRIPANGTLNENILGLYYGLYY